MRQLAGDMWRKWPGLLVHRGAQVSYRVGTFAIAGTRRHSGARHWF